MRVDFPAPFGPRMAVKEPLGIVNVPADQTGRTP
jgi:hypothetical protein